MVPPVDHPAKDVPRNEPCWASNWGEVANVSKCVTHIGWTSLV